ncbi:MAG: VWA domain-containing protein [Alphaproteobacteria bacterium]
MGFAFPEAFALIVVVAPLLWLLWRGERQAQSALRAFHARGPGTWHLVCRSALAALFIAALAAIGARPYIESRSTGDFLFLVDVSRSMNARYSCGEPTFLDRSKTVMRDVIAKIPEGKFGIAAFDRLAIPITQMTFDHTYLEEVIEHGLFVGLTYQSTATKIGNALAVVAGKKNRLPEFYGNVSHVILLSDGHVSGSYQRRFQPAFEALRKAGIRILAVGIGNPGETPIPVRTQGGACTRELASAEGRTVLIPLRDDILTFIAAGTRGKYFGEGARASLVKFLRENGLRKIARGAALHKQQRRDASFWFLVFATLAGFGLFLANTTRLR